MFLTQSHHPQLLPPDAYRSDRQSDLERQHLLTDSWMFVGTTHEFPRDGSYLTLNLLDQPIVVWRRDDQYRGFLNVCPHRYSTLTDQPAGQCDRLVCQYHGWEFDAGGDTRKIPDAVNFRPLKKGMLGLTPIATAVVGNLVLVNLHPDPTSIEDFFGDQLPFVKQFYNSPRPVILRMDQPHDCNWKVVVENALESYHVSMVHSKTLGQSAEAERCNHEIYDNGSRYIEDLSQSNEGPAGTARRILNFLRFQPDRRYHHLLVHPSLMFTNAAPFSLVQNVIPLTPTTSISRWVVLGYQTDPPTTRQRLLHPLLKQFGKRFFTTLLEEDRVIQASVQRGLNSARIPRGGLISAREERIFHFQRMVCDRTGIAPETDTTQSDVTQTTDNDPTETPLRPSPQQTIA